MLHEIRHLDGNRIGTNDRAVLNIERVADCARFSLRFPVERIALASAAFGAELPVTIGAVGVSKLRLALCLGPDEWQILAPLDEAEAIEDAFGKIYPDCAHSLVDISHRELGILVEGSAAELALRSACPLDVSEMAVGTATRTIFDRAQIILFRQGRDRFRIEVWQSFADHVWGILEAAGREIALEI